MNRDRLRLLHIRDSGAGGAPADSMELLANGSSEDKILTEYPQLNPDDIRAAIAYSAMPLRRDV